MIKPFIGPFGLSLRNVFLLGTIASSMALSACMSAQEKKQREDALARLQAEQAERLRQVEREEAAKKKTEQEAGLNSWIKANETYLRGLCASEPGAEHQFAWEKFRVAVSTDKEHASEAEKLKKPVIDCEQFQAEEPAAFNVDKLMEQVAAVYAQREARLVTFAGYTWSNVAFAAVRS